MSRDSTDTFDFPDYDTPEERERALRWVLHRRDFLWRLKKRGPGQGAQVRLGDIYDDNVEMCAPILDGFEDNDVSLDLFCQSDAEVRAQVAAAEGIVDLEAEKTAQDQARLLMSQYGIPKEVADRILSLAK